MEPKLWSKKYTQFYKRVDKSVMKSPILKSDYLLFTGYLTFLCLNFLFFKKGITITT